MKRNRPPVRPAPAVIKGLFAVAPKWRDVVIGDLAYMWHSVFGK